ncbi:hypothetical protein [Methylocella silvestris]|uniref:Uncharacterized protein n=1 Tax=Methylocella silvestris TaxID=199596 RepID=A0A2J7TBT7_METSI|nr:hypothetical protein [Methylocella silvestris]PNG24232.1 hypothetical protein CR492_19790 [Methylocella silvestris]
MTITGFFSAHSNGTDQTARVLVWEQMLHQALRLLEEAQRRVCSPDGQEQLRKLDGWWRVTKSKLNGKVCLVPSEEAISEALCTEMERIRDEIVLKKFPVDATMAGVDTLAVASEQPRKIKTGIGKRSKPTDIRIYRLNSDNLDLRIEAKVVLREADIKNAYLSGSGLKRFSDPREPYTNREIGGMVAYALTDDKATWLARIDHALRVSTPPVPTFKHRIQTSPDETLFSRVPCATGTSVRNEVLVFHVVLEFACEPDARP